MQGTLICTLVEDKIIIIYVTPCFIGVCLFWKFIFKLSLLDFLSKV
jgi:hypothetical protein